MQVNATAEKAAQYATSNKELEDRVRVLERIVTDGGYDVATQIEALRDQRRVEESARRPARPFAQLRRLECNSAVPNLSSRSSAWRCSLAC